MHRLKLPRFGQTMEQGTITAWHVAEGDAFDEGDLLYEVESEKSEIEVEAKAPGTVAKLVVAEGDVAEVGDLLAVIADPDEELTDGQISDAIEDGAGAPTEASDGGDGDGDSDGEGRASRDRRPTGGVKAMPRAKRAAQELGVDLRDVTGTGHDGAITESDVREAAEAAGGDGEEDVDDGPAVRERRTLRGVARAQAEHMARSWQIPQFSQDVEVDATALRSRLERLQDEGVHATVTDLLVDAVVDAVAEVPDANSSFRDDAVLVYEDVNVSIAVATESGLVVPVLRSAQSVDLAARVQRRTAIVERARDGALAPADSEGGTITVSNLGATRVETGVPLVSAPQACIVFAGRIADAPVVRDGEIVVRSTMHVVIAYDHRVIDGATAARFTTAVVDALERPEDA